MRDFLRFVRRLTDRFRCQRDLEVVEALVLCTAIYGAFNVLS